MRLVLIPLLLSTTLACVEDVGAGKVKAKVEDVPAVQKLERAAPDADKVETPELKVDSYAVDASRSSIRALGAKITATHPIDFKTFTGKLGLSNGELKVVSFEVKMSDLMADHPKLTEHLLDADFFNVAANPTSSFISHSITAGGEGGTHTIVGDMTIMGKTKRLTFPANVTIGDAEITANTEFVIDRKDFGVVYPGKPDDLIQDNVKMTISLVAPRG